MIISKKYAKQLVRKGDATETTEITETDGRRYMALDRHDVQRVDHYRLG